MTKPIKCKVVYNKDNITETLGEVLEKANKTQIRIAETEKYPHVTFFFPVDEKSLHW
jgi:2,3-bisphosphoglycerate-independent phosphoglycerate mutase